MATLDRAMGGRWSLAALAGLLALPWAVGAGAAEEEGGELFQFFEEEARVVTASRRPQPIRQAPATVYVVNAEEIEALGAQTLWDALRGVPGVDVMSARTMYGAVSIRGLNKVLNNRTLVLVDDRPVLSGAADNLNWEGLPVLLEEVERIEVVEGPASALYGANAINGVINVITRSPKNAGGTHLKYTFGERSTHFGSLLHGGQRGPLAYSLGLGARSTHSFARADEQALSARKVHAYAGYELGEEQHLNVRWGSNWSENQISLGGLGQSLEDGERHFFSAAYRRGDGELHFFWNGERERLGQFVTIDSQPELDYDAYSLSAQHTLHPWKGHELVVGAEFRRNAIASEIIDARHDLWAFFFADEWIPRERWLLSLSGRLDRHPLVGAVFSPRFSAIYAPIPQRAWRLSAGTSFRNPTLMENHLNLVESLESGSDLVEFIDLEVLGNPDLRSERLLFLELAHSRQLGRLQIAAALFHYRLENSVEVGNPVLGSTGPGRLSVNSTFANGEDLRARGGEAGAEVRLPGGWRAFANYAYQTMEGDLDGQVSAGGRPRHKGNLGLRLRGERFSLALTAHAVGRTLWNANSVFLGSASFVQVDAYALLNGHLSYRFAGSLESLRVQVDAFNLLDDAHYEVLPEQSALSQGQGGEVVRARRTLSLIYSF